jgi:hypothetical protein
MFLDQTALRGGLEDKNKPEAFLSSSRLKESASGMAILTSDGQPRCGVESRGEVSVPHSNNGSRPSIRETGRGLTVPEEPM